MMKLSILFFVGLFVVACSKSKRMVNILAGTWQFYDILHYDGSHSYPNETYIFEKGEADGETFLPLKIINNNDTINGSYLIAKKGDMMHFVKAFQSAVDVCSVEDFGKNLLVVRNVGDVWYFKKLK